MRVFIRQGEEAWARLRAELRKYPKRAGIAFAFGAYEGLQPVLEDAKRRAPKDTTAMARSGYVAKPQIFSDGGVRVEGGFGGDSEQYVVRQHEDTSLNHPNGGEAKFLQNALDTGEAGIRAAIAKWIKAFLATGKIMPFPPKRVPESPWEDRV